MSAIRLGDAEKLQKHNKELRIKIIGMKRVKSYTKSCAQKQSRVKLFLMGNTT